MRTKTQPEANRRDIGDHQDWPSALVFIGDEGPQFNSAVKGHIRGIRVSKWAKAFKQQPNVDVVANVDEFNSTKKCSLCWRVLEYHRRGDRTRWCRNCPVTHQLTDPKMNGLITNRKRRRGKASTEPQEKKRKIVEEMNRGRQRRRRVEPKRYQPAPSSHRSIIWNRDINASVNIRHIGNRSTFEIVLIVFSKWKKLLSNH